MDYPRPQLVRQDWKNLNGKWAYSFDSSLTATGLSWQSSITVPYPPESELSGVNDQAYHPVIWYKREFDVPGDWQGKRILLHFGAVDYQAQVWLNDKLVATHVGGHTPFQADVSSELKEGNNVLVVRAADDPLDLAKPRGKQEWQEKPHAIWYPRTTGIWQTVWLEPVAETYISKLRLTPCFDDFSFDCRFDLSQAAENLSLELRFSLKGKTLAQDSCTLTGARLERTISLGVTGFDDLRNYVWSPENPNLIDVSLKLLQNGQVIDEVQSYTAMRRIETRQGKVYLNHHPYYLRLALDQGYWDESLLAAPSSEALKKDVELAKAMGFNGVRKHQKIEDPRFLYWADQLGLLVWEEMPSAYIFTSDTVERISREWLEVIDRDYNHPCIVAWVCFNESWGVPNLVHDARQRDFVAGLYHLTKSLDTSRLVIGNDGWEHVVTDLLTIHDYHRKPETLLERYGTAEGLAQIASRLVEHGRISILNEGRVNDEPIILSEFGGIRFSGEAEGWGYQQVESAEALLELYGQMINALSGANLAGFCYTQFADTFQEQNGLLYSDRRPKVALDELAKATLGRR
ncbi:MAG: glycoside hydrolase family 2 [Trueperaceae bacterium]|nr:glycoside hydrolase family 2 [Trueperaceae bacterium]